MEKVEMGINCLGLSFFTYLIGGFDALFNALLIFIVLDYLTGLCKGIYKKKLNSKKSMKGIIKKIGYLCVVVLATIFGYIVHDESMAIRTLTLYFFIANEAISILENWAIIGLPLPKKLVEVFNDLKEDEKY